MFFVGLDLGQKRDHTAVAVVERIEHRRAFLGTQFDRLIVRYAERMALGMPYPMVVERVRKILRSQELFYGHASLAVDATGVGAPVVDMLNAAQLGCRVTAITITGGERGTTGRGAECVPKRDLMAELLVLLECGKLTIGNLKEGQRLVRELCDVRSRVSPSGRTRIGADGTGQHDDLTIAVALACWSAKRKGYAGEGTKRLV